MNEILETEEGVKLKKTILDNLELFKNLTNLKEKQLVVHELVVHENDVIPNTNKFQVFPDLQSLQTKSKFIIYNIDEEDKKQILILDDETNNLSLTINLDEHNLEASVTEIFQLYQNIEDVYEFFIGLRDLLRKVQNKGLYKYHQKGMQELVKENLDSFMELKETLLNQFKGNESIIDFQNVVYDPSNKKLIIKNDYNKEYIGEDRTIVLNKNENEYTKYFEDNFYYFFITDQKYSLLKYIIPEFVNILQNRNNEPAPTQPLAKHDKTPAKSFFSKIGNPFRKNINDVVNKINDQLINIRLLTQDIATLYIVYDDDLFFDKDNVQKVNRIFKKDEFEINLFKPIITQIDLLKKDESKHQLLRNLSNDYLPSIIKEIQRILKPSHIVENINNLLKDIPQTHKVTYDENENKIKIELKKPILSGGKKSNSYQLNGEKVEIIHNNKKLKRSIYVKTGRKTRYVKIDNDYIPYSKCKKPKK